MKHNCLLLIAFLGTLLSAHAQTIDANDEAGIQQTIGGETAAYANRDSALQVSYYVDDPITQCAWNAPDGSYGNWRGIETIRQNVGDDIQKHPGKVIEPTVERSDWFYRPLGKDWMWVNFIQRTTGTDGKKSENYETRIMKKEKGRWKIAVMYALSDHGKH